MTLLLRFVTHSEVGLVRKNNQDSGYASPRLLVVADGMGGAAAGDLASAIAIDAIRRMDESASGQVMLERLAEALHQANDRIADMVDADYTLEGMGTTVTGAVFDGASLGLAHIGDSRAYRLRDGRLERLTHDHSWVQSLVDTGRISEVEAAIHPHRSLLLKVLNGQSTSSPDLRTIDVQEGDRLLLCSDGVCGLVDDSEIAAALRQPTLDDALQQLIAGAHAAGGIDNITAIVADVVADGGTDGTFVLGAASEREVPPEHTAEVDVDTIVTQRVSGAPAAAATTRTDLATEDEARYNPQPPHERPMLRKVVGAVIVLLIVGAGLGAGYAWTRTQYFVGAAGDQVAIFQGLSDPVPGLRLSRVYEVQPIAVSSLPPYYQERVRATIDVTNLQAARDAITELTEAVQRCAEEQYGRPNGKPSPSPPATATPTTHPTATPRTAPPATAEPTMSPSATKNPEQAC